MFFKAVLLCKCLLKFLPLSAANVYNYLWRHHGPYTSRLFGQFVKEQIRLRRLKSAVAFILTCKNENLVPTFARLRFANPYIADVKLRQKCTRHILQAEMKFKQRLLPQTAKFLRRLDAELKQSVSPIVYIRLQSISQEIIKRKMTEIEMTHKKKLDVLRTNKIKQTPQRHILDPVTNRPREILDPVTNLSQEMGDPVTNLSTYTLTDCEHTALTNGLNHVYPPEKLDQPQFLCNMEYFYARLLNVRTTYRHYEQKSATEVVRHQLTSSQLSAASELRETANSFRKFAQSELKKIGTEHRKTFSTLRSLAKNKSIIITRPDKGRGVVVMDRADYIQKMNTILDDRSAFALINHDPTLDNENELTRFLLVLRKEGFISDQEYKLACPTGSRPARIYGVPKLHKKEENYPLRPVMSATKTVAYGLGKMLAYRLNTLRTSPYMIKDRSDFVRKISKSKHVDKKMISFDVTSLFTKVPLTYTIDLILDRMFPTCSSICTYKQRSRLCVQCRKRRDLEQLLRTATSKTHFMFDNKMYVQHNGVAMGAPLAPIIADIFMSHLEETLMDRLKQSGVCEWYRYVDDTFVLVEPTTKEETILKILNNFHPSINFTHQPEKNGSLSFLDVWVTRSTETKKFETAVYRKETFTGLMIKWDSFVPLSYKKASIVPLIQRAVATCSNYSSLAIEFENIRQIGLHNGYPLPFIDTRIGIALSNHLKRSPTPSTTIVGCEKQKMYLEIPYAGSSTDPLKKKLSYIAGKIRPDLDVRFFTKPPSSVQLFFKTKDSVPKYLQSDIVYSVKCSYCGDLYVGKTERQGIRRLWEHGAPKSLFKDPLISAHDENHTNQEENDNAQPETIVRTRTTQPTVMRTTRIRAAPYPAPETLRRSSRIRHINEAHRNLNIENIRLNVTTDEQNQNNENKGKTAETSISRHEQETGHQMDWGNFKVVWHDTHHHRLLVKESLVIKAYRTPLNLTTHSTPMLVFPEGLPRDLVPNPDYTN
jgi:hypothetical protein